MRTRLRKISRENQNTNFMLKKSFAENRAVSEISWNNTVQPDRSQVAVKHVAYIFMLDKQA
jgi:hypothetical protein